MILEETRIFFFFLKTFPKLYIIVYRKNKQSIDTFGRKEKIFFKACSRSLMN